MGFSIELCGKQFKLGYIYEKPIHLDPHKNWQICLTSVVVYNSIHYIIQKNNEFHLVGDKGARDKIIIPSGTYKVQELLNEVRLDKKIQDAELTAIVRTT